MYPLVVLVVGVIVTTLNLVRASATTIQISWILLLIGIVLAVLYVALDASDFGVSDRRPVASTRFSPWLREHVLLSPEGGGMNFTHWRGSEKVRKNRARAARSPRVRWEVLGLPRVLGTRATTSMEDIRRQVAQMANSWLEQGHPLTQGRLQSAKPAHTARVR